MQAGSAYVYTDFQGLAGLKNRAAQGEQGSVAEVARQFESLMLQQVLKSMRQASFSDGLFDSDQSLFYRDIYDQQLSIHMAENGGLGLARVIERQLDAMQGGTGARGREVGDYLASGIRRLEGVASQAKSSAVAAAAIGSAESSIDAPQSVGGESVAAGNPVTVDPEPPAEWTSDSFVEHLWPWAKEAAGLLGLKPQALLAQAALETGWGRFQMKRADGAPAFNLFGIKADGRWQGDRVVRETLEYEQGLAVRRREAFRAYSSYADSFRDYVDFLRSSPRYGKALALGEDAGAYFAELQRAGYATDPAYAEKIRAVMEGPEMRAALRKALENLKNPPLQSL